MNSPCYSPLGRKLKPRTPRIKDKRKRQHGLGTDIYFGE